jgi:hypothetical protein
MTNYTPSSSGPINGAIATLDTTDLLLGGSTGNLNAATKQLADNTAYIYAKMAGFESIVTLAVSGGTSQTFTNANLLRNLVIMNQDANNYFTGTLPQCSAYPTGALANIKRQKGAYTKPVTIACHSGDTFTDVNGATPASVYLHNGESITLCNTGTTWQILHFEGSYYAVGDQMFGYVQKTGMLKRDGSTYNRADYPRLWAWAVANSLTVVDSDWVSNPGGSLAPYPYKSYFSQGDGSTTFKVPDDRGLFDRALDLGAVIDADRNSALLGSTPGSKEADGFASHTHGINQTAHTHGITDPGHTHSITGDQIKKSGTDTLVSVIDHGSDTDFGASGPFSTVNSNTTGVTVNSTSITISNTNTGGNETRPINVGKLPLIVY